tara:strand:+ start:1511 stop:2029 length:519 start_codon:yes stop_codon:yes gene_type:complete
MKIKIFLTAFLMSFIGLFYADFSSAQTSSTEEYKVFTQEKNKLSLTNVQEFLKKGDNYIDKNNFDKAKAEYDKARTLAKQLLSFYRDLSGSFRGLDARIPREMDKKGRAILEVYADSNMRLAALFRRQNQPEVSIPLLIEVIRLVSPTSSQGKKAYEILLELGFVNTPYLGG